MERPCLKGALLFKFDANLKFKEIRAIFCLVIFLWFRKSCLQTWNVLVSRRSLVSIASWPRLVSPEISLNVGSLELKNRKCTRLFPAFLFWLLVRVWRVRLTDPGQLTGSGSHPSPVPLLRCWYDNLFHSDVSVQLSRFCLLVFLMEFLALKWRRGTTKSPHSAVAAWNVQTSDSV